MSYILDALRKAEMERELSCVPGISSRQHLTNSVRRLPTRLWLAATAALLLGMAIAWLWLRPAGALPIQTTAPKGQVPQALPAPQSAPAKQQPAEQEGETSVAAAAAVAQPLLLTPAVVEAAVTPSTAISEQAPPAGVQDSAAKEVSATELLDAAIAPEEPIDTAVAMIAAEAERGWPDTGEDELQAKDPGSPAAADSAPIAGEVAEPEDILPPLLRTMPYRFQSTLPKITINAQAYAEEAQVRFVIINMNKYREGELTQEGMLVELIGKDFLVLSYQGQAFRIER